MPNWFWLPIAVFVFIDLAVIAMIVTRVRAGAARASASGAASPESNLFSVISGLRGIASEMDRVLVEFMQANYSGQTEQLPAALHGALDKVRALLAAKGVRLDEQSMRRLVVQIVVARKFASRADTKHAMESVPPSDVARSA